MIVASGAATNALIGFAAAGAHEARSMPSRRDRAHWRAIEQRLATGVPDGPPDSLDRALELLSRSARSAPPGTFVFVLSDFLPPPSPTRLANALAAGWDVIPVVVQDPVWERSFPDVSGVTLPLADPDDGTPSLVRLNRGEARARRELNEQRARALDQALHDFELDPVTITSSDLPGVHNAFLEWAERRRSRLARLSVSEAGLRARAAAVRNTPGARLLAVVLILGAATAAVVWAVLLDRPSSTVQTLDEPLTVKRALSTSAALFGDPIDAEIDVYTSDRSIAARSVRVSTDFAPYRVAATTVDRVGRDGVSFLRTRISLECLTRACLPPRGGTRVVRFQSFAVTFRTQGRDARVVVPWEPLQLSSRLPGGGDDERRDHRHGAASGSTIRTVARHASGRFPDRCRDTRSGGRGARDHGAVAAVVPRAAPLAATVRAGALTAADGGGRAERRRDSATSQLGRSRDTPR